METIFTHTPTADLLDQVGIPERNEADYVARINAEDADNASITILNDLSYFFTLTDNTDAVARIEKELEAAGAYANGFNE